MYITNLKNLPNKLFSENAKYNLHHLNFDSKCVQYAVYTHSIEQCIMRMFHLNNTKYIFFKKA